MHSIKSRLIFLLTLVLLTSLGVLGYLSIRSASQALQGETEKTLLNTAVESSKYVTARINTQKLYLETLVQNPMLSKGDISWEEKVAYFQTEAKRSGYYGFALADTKGQARIFDSGQTIQDISDQQYYQEALTGKSSFSDVIINKFGYEAVLIFATPVKENDKVIGVFYGWRNGLALSGIVKDINFGEKGYAYAINRQGIMRGHKNAELIINQFNPIEESKNNLELREWAKIIEDHMIKGEQGVEEYLIEGKDNMVGFAPVENSPFVIAIVAENDEVLAGVKQLRNNLIILTVITILLGIVIAYFISGIIADPIRVLSQLVDRLSKFDLSFDQNSKAVNYIKRKDEIGLITNSLTTMQMNFINLIKNISNNSQQVASSSEELTATSQQASISADEVARTIEDIAEGASEQAKNTEAGVLNINQLGELIEKDLNYVIDLNTSAEEVNKLKNEGFEVLKELVEKTERSNQATSSIYETILETNSSAEKIEQASQMIKNIADQTNLLALNAAIEAARAGEAGRGFAVVADEIRKLAEQSNAFTGEISIVIQELISKTGYAVSTVQEVGEIVAAQTESVENTHKKFQGIDSAIEKMKIAIEIINQSGREMEVKKDQIIGIIENLSAISEENAAGTEEVSASIEEQTASMEQIANASEALAKIVEEMNSSISKFKL